VVIRTAKRPFAVARADGDPVVFAGLWEVRRSPESDVLHIFSTITTDVNRQLAAIQDRMPVILEKTDWPVELGEIEGDVPALLRPLPEDVLRFWPVDKRVGNVKKDGPELLRRQKAPDEAATAEPSLL
jgi:putative SOS response-associated peptidase YedK